MRTRSKKIEEQIEAGIYRGLEDLPVPILELAAIARIARAAHDQGADIAAAVRAYALTITTTPTSGVASR